MPGLLLCFVLRYDAHKRAQYLAALAAAGIDPDAPLATTLATPNTQTAYINLQRITYFHCSLIGYFFGRACQSGGGSMDPRRTGLITATVSAEVFKAAQPALLYLVPFTLLPLLIMAYIKVGARSLVHTFTHMYTGRPAPNVARAVHPSLPDNQQTTNCINSPFMHTFRPWHNYPTCTYIVCYIRVFTLCTPSYQSALYKHTQTVEYLYFTHSSCSYEIRPVLKVGGHVVGTHAVRCSRMCPG
jgi:hypothetical protein